MEAKATAGDLKHFRRQGMRHGSDHAASQIGWVLSFGSCVECPFAVTPVYLVRLVHMVLLAASTEGLESIGIGADTRPLATGTAVATHVEIHIFHVEKPVGKGTAGFVCGKLLN